MGCRQGGERQGSGQGIIRKEPLLLSALLILVTPPGPMMQAGQMLFVLQRWRRAQGSGDKVGESGSEELLSAGKQEGTLVSAGTGSTHPLVGRGGQQGGFQGQWEGAPCSHLVREWPRSWIYSLLTRLLCGLPEHEITRLTGKNDMGLQSHSWEISL